MGQKSLHRLPVRLYLTPIEPERYSARPVSLITLVIPLVLLTEEQLREVVAGHPIGTEWPSGGGSEADIEKHLRRAVATLDSTGVLEVEADFDHYGSGYASYVHVFCEKTRGRSRTHRDGTDWIDGIAVYLSRLVPFAVYGREERTKHARGGSQGYVAAEDVYSLPAGDWQEEIGAIRRILQDLGFILPAREQLIERLPFDLKIPTILDDKHVYDAIFYWED